MLARLGLLIVLSAAWAPLTLHAATPTCDRDCLTGIVDAYLKAMVAHDASASVLAPGIKFTENTSILPLHEGLWATATGIDSYRVLVLDPRSEQAAYIGIVREHDRPVILAMRLAVQNGKITEAETVVARSLRSMEHLHTTRPGIDAIAPAAGRVPRAQIEAAANAYFDGIEHNSGQRVPFDPECDRLENGNQTTNNSNPQMAPPPAPGSSAPTPLPTTPTTASNTPAAGGNAFAKISAMGCKDQFDTGIFGYISKIAPRRGFVIDEERQSVFAFFMFNHNGHDTEFKLADGSISPAPFGATPWNMQMAELFKLREGKIWQVEAVGFPLPFGARTGWEK